MNKKSYNPKLRREFTDANRKAWDEAAVVHRKVNHEKVMKEISTSGSYTMDKHCLDQFSDIGIEGKTIAQLCCNNGRELLSLKDIGAGYCIGFDGTADFISQALELKAASGHTEVDFVTTDIYDIPKEFRGPYDIVMNTIGVISWMPNLGEFFKVYGDLTKPGGYIFVEDMHPVLMMYEEGEGEEPSYVCHSYFKQEPFVETASLDYYEGTQYESSPQFSFQHTLSDIMNAAILEGFVLKNFTELDYDISEFCKDLEKIEERPPLGFTMTWQKGA